MHMTTTFFQMMDCTVETTEDLLDILNHVTNPDEEIVEFEEASSEEHFSTLINLAYEQVEGLSNTEKEFIDQMDDITKNSQQTMKDALKNDRKIFKNEFLGNIHGAIYDLGIISFQVMRPGLREMLRKQEERNTSCHYRLETRQKMLQTAKQTFETLEAYADNLFTQNVDLQTLRDFSSKKVLSLMKLLEEVQGAEEKRTIVFVEKRFTAEALCYLITAANG